VRLNEFLDSGEGGVDVQAEWMEFRERKTSTLKQGFENARSNKEAAEGSDNVKVITNEDHVYLINLAIAGEEAEAA
jgi:CelD/BcsL family acetyltransferase involved in cellulose biosynthesis